MLKINYAFDRLHLVWSSSPYTPMDDEALINAVNELRFLNMNGSPGSQPFERMCFQPAHGAVHESLQTVLDQIASLELQLGLTGVSFIFANNRQLLAADYNNEAQQIDLKPNALSRAYGRPFCVNGPLMKPTIAEQLASTIRSLDYTSSHCTIKHPQLIRGNVPFTNAICLHDTPSLIYPKHCQSYFQDVDRITWQVLQDNKPPQQLISQIQHKVAYEQPTVSAIRAYLNFRQFTYQSLVKANPDQSDSNAINHTESTITSILSWIADVLTYREAQSIKPLPADLRPIPQLERQARKQYCELANADVLTFYECMIERSAERTNADYQVVRSNRSALFTELQEAAAALRARHNYRRYFDTVKQCFKGENVINKEVAALIDSKAATAQLEAPDGRSRIDILLANPSAVLADRDLAVECKIISRKGQIDKSAIQKALFTQVPNYAEVPLRESAALLYVLDGDFHKAMSAVENLVKGYSDQQAQESWQLIQPNPRDKSYRELVHTTDAGTSLYRILILMLRSKSNSVIYKEKTLRKKRNSVKA